jgi:hypothetical protein
MADEDEKRSRESPDGDETAHERMEQYEKLADREKEYRNRKRTTLDSVSEELTSAVETAIETTGTNVVVESTGSNGATQTLGVRFDRADLIATVADELPAGFTIDSFDDDGTLTVEWNRRTENSAQQRATTILKAIVAEELTTDEDDLIESAPTRQEVLDRAAEFNVPEELATQRLDRLRTLDILYLDDGYVYPGGNFSRM